MTTTPNRQPLSLERAEDILAYIPHALGFHPERSVVLLLMVERKLEATLRVDLPKDEEPGEEQRWVVQVCEMLGRLPGLTSVLCAIFPDHGSARGGQLPWNSLLQYLAPALEEQGTPLCQAWCQGDGQVWDYLSTAQDHGCFDLSHPELNPASLRMVLAGSAPLSQPWDGQGVPEWSNAAQVRSLLEAMDGDCLDSLDMWAAVLGADPYSAEHLMRKDPTVPARLIRGLDLRMVRDILPYMAGVGTTAAVEAVACLGKGKKDGAVAGLSEFLLGRGPHSPRWDRIDHLWYICRDLLGVAQGSRRAALLCLMAWVEWAKGRGSMSMALLRSALAVEPDYRLAQLLEQLLLRGIMPQWATDPSRAWRAKFD